MLTPVSSTTINFLCPSNIPTSGTWDGISSDNTFRVGFQTTSGVVIETIDHGSNYSISDLTSGYYGNIFFGVNLSGDINERCNVITIIDTSEATFKIRTGDLGSWDPLTNTLIINWFDSGNDFGETAIYTYVP